MLSNDLTAGERETYRMVAAGDDLPPGRETDRLAALGLIEYRPYDGGYWAAQDPTVVARTLLAEALSKVVTAAEEARSANTFGTLAPHFDTSRMWGGGPSEFLGSRNEMNARIGDVTAAACESACTAQPGEPTTRDPQIAAAGVERMLATLQAGVRIRTLYNSLAASHAQTCGYVEQITDAGAEARTLGTPFPRMMIIDGKHLFVDNFLIPAAEADSGWHITDRGSVAWAQHVFNCFWDRGSRWVDLTQDVDGLTTTGRQRQILTELEAGYSQQQAGRRLGIAERTVAKELGTLRKALGVSSLYQVTMWWATSPDRDSTGAIGLAQRP
ncbi:LuxR C-terminal-related transcriptional regulator [Streptomyces sp. NPDC057580]|uniref:LuxR C-terminal-related transcriptional regulator n=1 Tax=Streptomyces sp. NPDC057580 TaxID=3346173 RepID=UPI00368DB3FC